jgi:hypothetical protein
VHLHAPTRHSVDAQSTTDAEGTTATATAPSILHSADRFWTTIRPSIGAADASDMFCDRESALGLTALHILRTADFTQTPIAHAPALCFSIIQTTASPFEYTSGSLAARIDTLRNHGT